MFENVSHRKKQVVRKLRSLLTHGPRLAWKRYWIRKHRHCVHDPATLAAEGFSSQFGQDKYVTQTLLPEKRGGYFVDIGANDGISSSNTYYLERTLGWQGVCIEPIPEVFALLEANRKCRIVHGCIARQAGTAKFIHVVGPCEMLSGLDVDQPPEHRARVLDEVARFGGSIEEYDVPCLSFNELMAREKVRQIDYLSLDTEGAELAILRTIDFQAVPIHVLDVENNYHGDHLIELLDPLGYELVAMVGCDEIYVLRGTEAHARLHAH